MLLSSVETFLYGFIVPILGYMLEVRLHVDPSQTQSLTSSLLAIHGFMTLVAAPIIAHFADKTPNRRMPLLIALAACAVGTTLVACSPSGKPNYYVHPEREHVANMGS